MNRIAIRSSLIAVLIVTLLAGCASTRSGAGAAVSFNSRKPAAAGLEPGEQVDYAGHRCSNPNFHVKTHPCVFPRRPATP